MSAVDIERDNRHHIGNSGRSRTEGLTNPREPFPEGFKERAVAFIGSDEDELTLRDELTHVLQNLASRYFDFLVLELTPGAHR